MQRMQCNATNPNGPRNEPQDFPILPIFKPKQHSTSVHDRGSSCVTGKADTTRKPVAARGRGSAMLRLSVISSAVWALAVGCATAGQPTPPNEVPSASAPIPLPITLATALQLAN